MISPVFIWQTPPAWLMPLPQSERMTEMSSAHSAMCGSQSEIQRPPWPCCFHLRLEASSGFRDGLRVRVSGVGRYDRLNHLQRLESVEHVVVLDPLDIGIRIDELKLLKEGWLDGKGVPPARQGLDWLETSFDVLYPADVALPYLFPTPEGRVLAEWLLSPWSPSVEIDIVAKSGDWHALNLETDAEDTRTLDLSNPTDWEWLAERIRGFGAGIA